MLAGTTMAAGVLAACSAPTPAQPSAGASAATTAPAASGPAQVASKPTAEAGPPRSGGELIFTVNADPPSLDIHQESTWATLYPTQGHYNLLVRFSQTEYPKMVPEVAESWTTSADGLVYDFKIRDGIAFHDGSILTRRDVKASYDHIIFPPQGVLSQRKALYTAVDSIDAPDPHTVRFTLKYATASFMLNLASPWNHLSTRPTSWPRTRTISAGRTSLAARTRSIATCRAPIRPGRRRLPCPPRASAWPR